jgi:hypothetical protein
VLSLLHVIGRWRDPWSYNACRWLRDSGAYPLKLGIADLPEEGRDEVFRGLLFYADWLGSNPAYVSPGRLPLTPDLPKGWYSGRSVVAEPWVAVVWHVAFWGSFLPGAWLVFSGVRKRKRLAICRGRAEPEGEKEAAPVPDGGDPSQQQPCQ